ncbi:hypothetical protein O181_002103 [Austropuccinia psidii MF-1]|uniref:Uncharacterized protein n=1 Tax=Austropuccinia psidii MF-1 TaxID=1389203 RepID=A0A9Q3BC35_9BASI|nr:hypothetical protein [Austropuccinia psidii MF-1]
MPILMHKLASATVSNHLGQQPRLLMLYPRHASTPTIADLQLPTLTLPHACAILSTPYHAYTPAVPYRCVQPPHLMSTLKHPPTSTCLCNSLSFLPFL